MPNYYPMMVNLTGRRCLVVGGGRVAERKVALLIECGASVELSAPPRPRSWRRWRPLAPSAWRSGRCDPPIFPGRFLVFVATDDPE